MDLNDDIPAIEFDEDGRRVYEPDGDVLAAFLLDRSHVSIIRGPIGSGTSSACCQKIMQIAQEQRPNPFDGKRRTRWGIVRNTYNELQETTVKTWKDWFPPERYGLFLESRPMRHEVRFADVECDVHFFALDRPDDVSKMRSLEMTGWWMNELEFIEKAIVDEAETRTGRYPAVKDGGSTWDGIIADLNAPRADHWLPILMGEVDMPEDMTEDERALYQRPQGWAYFVQPPGLLEVFGPDGKAVIGYEENPVAENARWLKPGYYLEKIRGKSKQFIDSRVLNKVTVFFDGRAVWPQYNPQTHQAREVLRPIPGWPVMIGLDFGREPAAIFGQLINNRWSIQRELVASQVGASSFAPLVKRILEQEYAGFTFYAYGDPKGRDGVQTDESNAYDIFRSFGIPVMPAPVKQNNINTRIEAVEHVLNGMVDGLPRFLVSPRCTVLRTGLAGGYHYRRIKGTSRHAEEPEKNRYSHPCDALQYLVLGAGEGRQMRGAVPGNRPKPVNTRPKKVSRRRI